VAIISIQLGAAIAKTLSRSSDRKAQQRCDWHFLQF